MVVLGIETTCDETAAAVVERAPDGTGKILSNIVRSQTEEHARFGGVVPEIAARAHVDVLDHLVEAAMTEAGADVIVCHMGLTTGGAIGAVLGGFTTTVYAAVRGWSAVVPVTVLIGAVAIALAIGVLAGLYPAMRAARLAPAEALRIV